MNHASTGFRGAKRLAKHWLVQKRSNRAHATRSPFPGSGAPHQPSQPFNVRAVAGAAAVTMKPAELTPGLGRLPICGAAVKPRREQMPRSLVTGI